MQTITPAQKIKMLREQKDLTQEKLADALRVSVGTIKNWENGIVRLLEVAIRYHGWSNLRKIMVLKADLSFSRKWIIPI